MAASFVLSDTVGRLRDAELLKSLRSLPARYFDAKAIDEHKPAAQAALWAQQHQEAGARSRQAECRLSSSLSKTGLGRLVMARVSTRAGLGRARVDRPKTKTGLGQEAARMGFASISDSRRRHARLPLAAEGWARAGRARRSVVIVIAQPSP
jgi:hypothetical protein